MLAQWLRSTCYPVLLVALIAAAAQEARAQEAGAHTSGTKDGSARSRHGASPTPAAPRVLPDGADEGANDSRMVLPPPPPAAVTVGTDATGSIGLGSAAAGSAGPISLPPPLAFDDPPAVAPLAASRTAEPHAAADPALEGAAAPTTAPVPAAALLDAATAPAAAPLDAATAPAADGLDTGSLASALAHFVDDTPPGARASEIAARRAAREDIAAFYAAHGDEPLWVADARLTAAARSVLARLDHAAEDGLDVTRFAVPVPRDAATATLAQAELAISEAVVAYARQATGSRIDVAKLGGLIDLRPAVAAATAVLASVPAAADAGDALHAFNPPQPGYVALRDKLAELRRQRGGDLQSRIGPGPVLKLGMSDARVPLIRARFGLDVAADDPARPPLVYDTRVAAAVAAFQRTHGLPVSGVLTARTIAALSGGNPTALESDIVANMELWRWLPRDLGPDRIEVNIPDYTARVVRDGAVTHQTRVVVGQPDKPTPVFAEQMRFIIVNPYWNVPLSIIKSEMMPKLEADPNYFANHGYEVITQGGVTYVRQPPGDGNALGRIKFMFPNTHAVYLHDTNAHGLFARDMRALSHGCVRVDQPFSFAEAVMGRDHGWSEARIRKLIGGQERTINLPKPLPIFITYFTAFVDDRTGFQMRDDVYGYATKVKLALGLQG